VKTDKQGARYVTPSRMLINDTLGAVVVVEIEGDQVMR